MFILLWVCELNVRPMWGFVSKNIRTAYESWILMKWVERLEQPSDLLSLSFLSLPLFIISPSCSLLPPSLFLPTSLLSSHFLTSPTHFSPLAWCLITSLSECPLCACAESLKQENCISETVCSSALRSKPWMLVCANVLNKSLCVMLLQETNQQLARNDEAELLFTHWG